MDMEKNTEIINNLRWGVEELKEFLEEISLDDTTLKENQNNLIERINEWIPLAESVILNFDECTKEEIDNLENKFMIIKTLKIAYDLEYYSEKIDCISEEKLISLLPKVGLEDMYKKWNHVLVDNGFSIAEMEESDLCDNKKIIYGKKTDLTVLGDHALDIVYVLGELSENGLDLQYYSSIIVHRYFLYSTQEEKANTVTKIQRFIDDRLDKLKCKKNEITIANDGFFILPIYDKGYSISQGESIILRLARMLDKEMGRRYPFCGIEYYQEQNQIRLKQIEKNLRYLGRSGRIRSHKEVLNILIGSDYNMTKSQLIEKFKHYSEQFSQYVAKMQARKPIGKKSIRKFEDPSKLIQKLECMTDKSYERLKRKAFDI